MQKMKKVFLMLCLSTVGMLLTGCSDNDEENSDGPGGGKLPDLPTLPDPEDVCTAMDDINFMAYCYETFDVNKDGKVSVSEANAVLKIDLSELKNKKEIASLKGIEYFPNLQSLNCKE